MQEKIKENNEVNNKKNSKFEMATFDFSVRIGVDCLPQATRSTRSGREFKGLFLRRQKVSQYPLTLPLLAGLFLSNRVVSEVGEDNLEI